MLKGKNPGGGRWIYHFMFSAYWGCSEVFMLPACAQR